ncbi:glycine-rich extracellular protein 1 isoform X2 [Carettochelys insculpta]|uniref:glycine-rich extracellular protein 1 isoform X2 n=1 Tax=Carettochelys insculpta TaxID=44489 RepID=UPI003EB88F33
MRTPYSLSREREKFRKKGRGQSSCSFGVWCPLLTIARQRADFLSPEKGWREGAKLQANGALGHLYLLSLIQGASGVHTGAILRLSGAKAANGNGVLAAFFSPHLVLPSSTTPWLWTPRTAARTRLWDPWWLCCRIRWVCLGCKKKPRVRPYHTSPGRISWSRQWVPSQQSTARLWECYGAGGNSHPGAGLQSGYGLGQLLYNGQTQQATPTGVGGDDGAGEYGGAGALMYRVQQSGSRALNGNGNGLGYANGGDLQANGLARGGYGRRTARQGPRGYRLTPAAYGSKEAKYGLNGFLGNGYRGHCTPRKC